MKNISHILTVLLAFFCMGRGFSADDSSKVMNEKIGSFLRLLEKGEVEFIMLVPMVEVEDPFSEKGKPDALIGYGEIAKKEIPSFLVALKEGFIASSYGEPGVTFRLIPQSKIKPYDPNCVMVCRLLEGGGAMLIFSIDDSEYRLRLKEKASKFLHSHWRTEAK